MLNSAISKCTKLITHGGCADGIMSAMFVSAVLPEIEIEWHQYNTEDHRNLAAEPGLLFCDFSPPRERVQEFINAGAVVLDHHKTARPLVEKFGPLGVFNIKRSGALLAYEYVLQGQLLARGHAPFEGTGKSYLRFLAMLEEADGLAHLVSIRDTWQKGHAQWAQACAISKALKSLDAEELLARSRQQLVTPQCWMTEQEHKLGKVLYDNDVYRSQKRAEHCKRVEFPSTVQLPHRAKTWTLATFNDPSGMISDVADYTDTDISAGFFYTMERDIPVLVYSLRSRGEFDVGDFCKSQGGGGHAGSAGFKLDNPSVEPFGELENRLREYLI